jgi:quercetin dioxygenase-like cupin family protein
MKLAISAAALGVVLMFAAPVLAAEDHMIHAPADLKWSPAPAALPKGAEVAVLFGDPSKEELFAMRIRFPANYQVPPHTHPKPELVTVISGTLHIGMGETADPSKADAVPAGGFLAITPGTAHYAHSDEETVIQLNSTGPWTLNYVNLADDPRKTQ